MDNEFQSTQDPHGESNSSLFSVPLKNIVSQFQLEKVHLSSTYDSIDISCSDVNRPGLPLSGFFDYLDPKRIQIFGKVEMTYLEDLPKERRQEILDELFGKDCPAFVVTRDLTIFPEMREAAKKKDKTLLRTEYVTSQFMHDVISYLSLELAPRITRHGVLVEVYGEGILIMGESGVGKSETAMELIKRGHRLVADDAVEIKKASDKTLVGSAPDVIRHFIELRGIGIVDVRRIFGMGAIKDAEKINLVINLEQWDTKKQYDRLGLDDEFVNILGNDVPSLNIPVKPGRNLAIIMEVAAMNNRQKRMGYNAAEELNQRIMKQMEEDQK